MNLENLIEIVRKMKMTDEQREAQRLSFAYGNTHLANENITREMFLEKNKMNEEFENFCLRPSLYLGKHSIYGLQCFLGGMFCVSHNNFLFSDEDEYENFEQFVRNKLSKNKKSFELALDQSNGNDSEAFYIWIEWLKEFKKIQ